MTKVAGAFVLSPSGSSLGPQLRMSGALVMDGQFGGAWAPIGAEQINGLYKVVWSNVGFDQYVIWTVDGNGNFLAQSNVLHAGNAELQSLEPGFNQDLDGGGIAARSVHRVRRVDDVGRGCGRLRPVAQRQLARSAAQDVRRARHGRSVR